MPIVTIVSSLNKLQIVGAGQKLLGFQVHLDWRLLQFGDLRVGKGGLMWTQELLKFQSLENENSMIIWFTKKATWS